MNGFPGNWHSEITELLFTDMDQQGRIQTDKDRRTEALFIIKVQKKIPIRLRLRLLIGDPIKKLPGYKVRSG